MLLFRGVHKSAPWDGCRLGRKLWHRARRQSLRKGRFFRLNRILGEGKPREVHFTDFVVQQEKWESYFHKKKWMPC